MLMRLDELDNVAVILEDGKKGQKVPCGNDVIELLSNIPFGHKCALTDIDCGEIIYKYGYPIGYATEDIKRGQLVNENNMSGFRGRGDLESRRN